ncbi:VWA domain-containing protein|uniref:VWA domain-containing protein n=1 Tax=Stenotrophomonas sp. SbOxS2 TaxID=2723885 RepID=UPI0015D2C253|nr:VWA domain-containing protein [Stenotrophomonas sp. SbOxS2]NYT99420.1 VWA domain-containing protein [Stenotrophomonas sp. SbOxS2]
MDMVLQSPWAAVLLVLLPLLWWRTARLPRWQPWLRATLLVCVVFALMQPSLLVRGDSPAQVIVLDQRAALPDPYRSALRQRLQQRLAAIPAGTRITVVQLGGQPLKLEVQSYLRLREQSPVEALAAALQQLPASDGGRLLYLGAAGSDDPHWGRVVSALLERGVKVDIDGADAAPSLPRLVDVDVPSARAGGLATARIRVDGTTRGLQVAVLRDDVELVRSAVPDVQGPSTVTLQFAAGSAGFHPLRVVLRDGSGGVERGALSGILAVQDPLPLLYVARDPSAGMHLQRLLGDGFAVRQQAPEAVDAASFTGQDIAVLDGIGVELLPAPAQTALASAVTVDGLGLVFSGGSSAFSGLPQDPTSGGPLAQLLPVSGKPHEQLQDPSVALVVIIDSSGSMAGAPMDLAKQIARLAVRRLKPEDRVGVVEFYGARQWSVPIQPARDTADVERAIGRMQAQGGTQLFPAIQEAYFGLKNTDARFKHMLVITDAGVEEDNYQRLLRHIAQDRINVSTALVGGGEGEERMAELANWGRGRFYQVSDDASMVELNLKQPQLQPSPGYRSGRFSVHAIAGQAWWQDDSLLGMPPLQGIATAVPRSGAQLMARAGDEPFVASWQHGSGRVTSIMTEPLGAGTQGWEAWRGYGHWLSRLLVGTARQQPSHAVQVNRDGRSVQVVVEGSDAKAVSQLQLVSVDADGSEKTLSLQPMSPTLLIANLQARDEMRLLLRGDGTQLRVTDGNWRDRAGGPAVLRYSLPLQKLAALSAGVSADAVAGWRVLDLRTWLALLAIGLYLLEVLCRRWAWHTPSFFRKPR